MPTIFLIEPRDQGSIAILVTDANMPEEAKALLTQEEKRHPPEGRKPGVFRIAPARSLSILKVLAATGDLRFKGQKVIGDFFGKTPFSFHIAPTAEGKVVVTGMCKTSREEFNLNTCDFVCPGPPSWYLKGAFLKVLHAHLSWKDISLLRSSTAFSAQELQSFLETHTDTSDPDLPHIIFAEGAQDIAQAKEEPVPRLILQDRVGAFAILMMDYPGGASVPFHDASVPLKQGRRLLDQEKSWERDLLETDFQRKQVDRSHYYCPVDKIAKSLTFLLECGWTIFDNRGNRIHNQGETSLTAGSFHNDVIIKGNIRYDDFSADVTTVVGAFNRRERFVQLSPGHVGLVPDRQEPWVLSTLAEEAEIVQDAVRIKKSKIGALKDLWNAPGFTADATLTNLQERLKDFHALELAAPGHDFHGTLRPYQQEGVNWLSFLYEYGFHGLLADDMGLGKTVQVLAFLSRLQLEKPVLIVVPTSLLFNWQHEIQTFLGPSAYMHYGTDRASTIADLPAQGIILTSYTTLRLDLSLLKEFEYQCIILDEAQAIKNPSAQTTQAVYQLRGQFRLSISGTPVENRLEELWSHFRFLMPDLLGTQETFAADALSAGVDSRYLQKIRQKIRPFLLRRRKEEVAKDLPEKIEQVMWIEMPEDQRRFYEDFLTNARSSLLKKVQVDGMAKHRMEVLETLLRLRQICCHPALVSSLMPVDGPIASGKLDALLSDIDSVVTEGHKVLVYSQFTSMLRVIERHLREQGTPFVTLDGTTNNREEVVQRFQQEPELPVFLISLKAGGSGLNLTAADYVFLYDPWWNQAVEDQAISRAHRIGRHHTVFAKRYIMAESIEEKIMTLKANKSSLVDDLFNSDSLRGSVSVEDFQFLLS